jgi:hypothetical protein
MWIKEAVTPAPNGNGDSAGGIGGDPPWNSESSSSSSSSSSSFDNGDDVLPPLPTPGGTDYSEPPALPLQVPRKLPRAPNSAKKQKIDLPYKFKGDPTDRLESYRHWMTGVDRYLRYFRDEYNNDDNKIIFVGSIL